MKPSFGNFIPSIRIVLSLEVEKCSITLQLFLITSPTFGETKLLHSKSILLEWDNLLSR